VTVVPGIGRYHRAECILIRFLGAGDLEIMSRQEAEEAKFVPCRACQPDQLES
jgi:methylphosphotriester-DNA--protein-cysteine methyltransferase